MKNDRDLKDFKAICQRCVHCGEKDENGKPICILEASYCDRFEERTDGRGETYKKG